ncbi:hypothetical protein JCM19538_1225 [Jejuia pallidilutea]|uniref:Uncharacterized protein n=1 Tax=Jejuia pallidilutea TaxID=504487 RepID=A0A098LPG3_9FLAO|nr:hypothetical protein JCM19538_1225 [Jejuia pallidilutea]
MKKENPKLKNELNLGFFYRLFYNALNSECATKIVLQIKTPIHSVSEFFVMFMFKL